LRALPAGGEDPALVRELLAGCLNMIPHHERGGAVPLRVWAVASS
jgi:hypothetical protein